MAAFVSHTTVDCTEAYALSEWWKAVLGYVDLQHDPNGPGDEQCMIRDPASGHRLLFIEVPDASTARTACTSICARASAPATRNWPC